MIDAKLLADVLETKERPTLSQPEVELVVKALCAYAQQSYVSSAAIMTEDRARKELVGALDKDGGLYNLGWYLGWNPDDDNATLDGRFTADELEAIAWWMRNKRAAPTCESHSNLTKGKHGI